MDTLPRVPWAEELDEFLSRCEEQPVPTRRDTAALVQELCDQLRRAPDSVKQRFPLPPRKTLQKLLESGAIEQVLLMITGQVGMMTSRSPSGFAIATVAVPDLNIEKTFSNNKSMGLAMTGAIAGAAIGIFLAERRAV